TQLGMSGQSQVIVGGKVDHFPAVKGANWRLLVIQHPQAKMRALGFEIVQLLGQVRKRISTRGSCHVFSRTVADQYRIGWTERLFSLYRRCGKRNRTGSR